MLLSYRPPPPLARFVELFWIAEGPARPHGKERLLPDGSLELVINLREDRVRTYDRTNLDQCHTFPGCILIGPHSEYFVIDTDEQQSVMGVHFRPGGAFPFFKLPAGDLQDQHVDLGALWGLDSVRLREQLLAAPTADVKFEVFERFLLARAYRPLLRHPAVAYALREFGAGPRGRTITELTDEIGLSSRRFIEVFSAEVGLTPKLFHRIQRFQRVLGAVARSRRVEWALVAADCGYFDQAHFIRDFRAFSGLNPSAYNAQRTEHLNHVPIAG